jgi:hypothetical protein
MGVLSLSVIQISYLMLQNTLNTQYIRYHKMLMSLQYLPPHALLAQTSMKTMLQPHKHRFSDYQFT